MQRFGLYPWIQDRPQGQFPFYLAIWLLERRQGKTARRQKRAQSIRTGCTCLLTSTPQGMMIAHNRLRLGILSTESVPLFHFVSVFKVRVISQPSFNCLHTLNIDASMGWLKVDGWVVAPVERKRALRLKSKLFVPLCRQCTISSYTSKLHVACNGVWRAMIEFT